MRAFGRRKALGLIGLQVAVCVGIWVAPPAGAQRGGVAASTLLESPRAALPGEDPMTPESVAAAALAPGRTDVEAAWFDRGSSLGQRAHAARIAGLRLGIRSLDDAARSLLGAPGRPVPLDRAMIAARLAPDLPYAHLALAGAYWREGERGEALRSLEHALVALPRHPDSVFWLLGTFLGLFAFTLVAGAAVCIALLALRALPSATHDLGDPLSRQMPGFARGALLASLLLVPLLLGEGLLGLVLALFALGFTYGGARQRVALAASAAFVVLGLYPVAWYAGKVLLASGADPVAEASWMAWQGKPSRDQLQLLVDRAPEDSLAASALAARSRQLGRTDETRFRYRALLESAGSDPVALNNAANLLFESGETESAIDLYERSALQLASAELLFNLSQAYGRAFRMDELERSLAAAQEVDSEVLNELTLARDANFVVDLPPPDGVFRLRSLEAADGEAWAAALRSRVAPGRLGERWLSAALGFAAVGVLGLLAARLYRPSSGCRRCGARLCPRCDGEGDSSESCENCRRLFRNSGSTDPAMRVARIGALRRRQVRLDRAAAVVGLLVPGAAGIAARRPDLAFVGALVGTWAVLAFVGRDGLVPEPMVLGPVGPAVVLATACAAGLGHLGLALAGVRLRRNG